MKDHEKRELVNALTEVAVKYAGTQQLRERIAQVLLPALREKPAADIPSTLPPARKFKRYIYLQEWALPKQGEQE